MKGGQKTKAGSRVPSSTIKINLNSGQSTIRNNPPTLVGSKTSNSTPTVAGGFSSAMKVHPMSPYNSNTKQNKVSLTGDNPQPDPKIPVPMAHPTLKDATTSAQMSIMRSLQLE